MILQLADFVILAVLVTVIIQVKFACPCLPREPVAVNVQLPTSFACADLVILPVAVKVTTHVKFACPFLFGTIIVPLAVSVQIQ